MALTELRYVEADMNSGIIISVIEAFFTSDDDAAPANVDQARGAVQARGRRFRQIPAGTPMPDPARERYDAAGDRFVPR